MVIRSFDTRRDGERLVAGREMSSLVKGKKSSLLWRSCYKGTSRHRRVLIDSDC